jgi:hypothetical protein
LFGTKEEKKRNQIEQKQQQDKKNYMHQTINRRIKQRDYARKKNIEEEKEERK